MVKRNNVVRFTDGGGTIRNRATKEKLNFYEFEGVYFLKLKVADPDRDVGLDFHRPDRP